MSLPLQYTVEGSCIDAGYTDCCTADLCLGEPDGANCYCDESCLFYEDCCSDFYDICRGMTRTCTLYTCIAHMYA